MKLLLIAAMLPGMAQAITCETDNECLTASISLIRKAIKKDVCVKAAGELANELRQKVASDSANVRKLELCLFQAKKAGKRDSTQEKRLKRIEKAMNAK